MKEQKFRHSIDLEKYTHSTYDTWRWQPAAGTDVVEICDLALVHFRSESEGIFENNPVEYSRNVTLAIVTQFYNPKMELLSVARSTTHNHIVAYTWAKRGHHVAWSTEEMVSVEMAHIDQNLSARERVFLCAQMIQMWEVWSAACDVKIISSSTIRSDQTAFLDLHRAAGYSVRGSVAYKRLKNMSIQVEPSPFAETFMGAKS
jgi:hypothetical protein